LKHTLTTPEGWLTQQAITLWRLPDLFLRKALLKKEKIYSYGI